MSPQHCTKKIDSKLAFPRALYAMLDEMEKTGQTNIASWQPHGKAFRVHKPKEFVTDVMPQYFKQTKWASFQRQLNLYGFIRFASGQDKGGYFHEMFISGKPHLVELVKRTKIKGTKVRLPSNPELEPNFYSTTTSSEVDETTTTTSDEEASSEESSSIATISREPSPSLEEQMDFSEHSDTTSLSTAEESLEESDECENDDFPFFTPVESMHLDDIEISELTTTFADEEENDDVKCITFDDDLLSVDYHPDQLQKFLSSLETKSSNLANLQKPKAVVCMKSTTQQQQGCYKRIIGSSSSPMMRPRTFMAQCA